MEIYLHFYLTGVGNVQKCEQCGKEISENVYINLNKMCLQCFSKNTEKKVRKKKTSQSFGFSSQGSIPRSDEPFDFTSAIPTEEEMKEKLENIKKKVNEDIAAITGVKQYEWPEACVGCGDDENLSMHSYVHCSSDVTDRGPAWLTALGLLVGFLIYTQKIRKINLPVFPSLCNDCEINSKRSYYIRILGILSYWIFSLSITFILFSNFYTYASGILSVYIMVFSVLSSIVTPIILIWYASSRSNPAKRYYKIKYKHYRNRFDFKFKSAIFSRLFKEANISNFEYS